MNESGRQRSVHADETRCWSCGYNLVGLPSPAVCPECGEPADPNMRKGLLRNAPPEYLRSLWFGVRLIRWGLVGWIIAVFVALLIATPWYLLGGEGWAALVLLAALFGFLFALLCLGVGLWLMSSADPEVVDEARWSPRRLMRATVVGAATCLAAAAGVWIIEMMFEPDSALLVRGMQILKIGLSNAALVFVGAHLHGFGRHAALLARRVNDRRFSSAGLLLAWIGAPFSLIYITLMTLAPILWSDEFVGTRTPDLLSMCAGLGLFIILCLYCWLIDRLRLRLCEIMIVRRNVPIRELAGGAGS